jgi:hypothetical protein
MFVSPSVLALSISIQFSDVITALENAQAAMAAVNYLLDDAKAAAHASLNSALAGYAQDNYSPENWTILLDTIEVIDKSASVADVATALNNAQAEMAAVHTLLTDAKIAAHISLNEELAVYNQADYSPDNWSVLNGFKEAGDTAIDEASEPAEAEAAQSAAAAGMEGVQTIAGALAAAKSAAHEALAAIFGTYIVSDDKVNDEAALTECKVTGDMETDAAAEIVQTEELPADAPDLTAGTEAAESETVIDALPASEEIPATDDSSDAAEEISGDLGPAPEGVVPDAAN